MKKNIESIFRLQENRHTTVRINTGRDFFQSGAGGRKDKHSSLASFWGNTGQSPLQCTQIYMKLVKACKPLALQPYSTLYTPVYNAHEMKPTKAWFSLPQRSCSKLDFTACNVHNWSRQWLGCPYPPQTPHSLWYSWIKLAKAGLFPPQPCSASCTVIHMVCRWSW